MGEVFRAHHRTEAFAARAGGDVAIKVLHSQYASRPDIVERFEQEAALGHFSRYLDPMIFHQAMGAMIALVLGFLWTGRRHLGAVARKALWGDPTVDDSDEIVSYRVAVCGVVCGLGV